MGRAQTPENEVTSVVRSDAPAATPVFVDPSGGRRRRIRRMGWAVAVLLVLVLTAVWASQLGGPARPPVRVCPSAGCPR